MKEKNNIKITLFAFRTGMRSIHTSKSTLKGSTTSWKSMDTKETPEILLMILGTGRITAPSRHTIGMYDGFYIVLTYGNVSVS